MAGAAEPPTVTVRGTAVVRAEPDEAIVPVTLEAVKDDPGAALSDVSARSDALVALLDELGVTAADRSTSGVSVSEDVDYTSSGRQSRGHRATARATVRLQDAKLIGTLITRATTELGAHVDGPHWRIALDNPRRLDAARQAAADGRRRAEAYAEGIAARLGAVVALSEPGMAMAPKRVGAMPMALAAGGPQPPIPIETGEQEITATVEVTFALEV
jgi:uncharacterized protein YggE